MEIKEKYIAFCKQEDFLPIFFQPWYLEGVCPKGIWEASIAEKDGKVVGIFPYYKKTKKPYTYITMPPNSRMMGPYVTYDFREQEVYRKIQKKMLKEIPLVEFFFQSFHYAVTDWFNFYSSKFSGKKLYSFILNGIEDLPKTYSTIHRNLREKIIPEARKEVEVKSGLDPEMFYEMYSQNKDYHNKKVDFTLEAFKSHHDSLIKNKAGSIFYTEDKEGNIHSAGLLMWDRLSSYFYLTAEKSQFKYSGSLPFLTWKCIEFSSKELKLNFFDFGGNLVESAENPNHPFGAAQVPFLNVSHYDASKFGPFKSLKKRLKKK
jgi:hypothetical protein